VRQVTALLKKEYQIGLSRKDHTVLALQAVNRLNHVIGKAGLTGARPMEEMRLLQTYVNNLTLGIKRDSDQQMKIALAGVKELIEKGESKTSH
jgi:hypothetical protein